MPLGVVTTELTYHPPIDWRGLTRFLGARAMAGVESVREDVYLRTIRLTDHAGWIRVRHESARHVLLVETSESLTPVVPAVLDRLHHLFDLNARPDAIVAALGRDPFLAPRITSNPGLRVPGAFDVFELAVRAILGQQITVKAATTIGGRFAAAFGDPTETPHGDLTRLSPTARRIAGVELSSLTALGITRMRARSIIALATEMSSGRLRLEPATPPADTIAQLIAVPGIGPWTAQYIAMRVLRWGDAFPPGDIAVRKALGGVSAARADAMSQAWRPWRSYATLHLWQPAPSGAPGS